MNPIVIVPCDVKTIDIHPYHCVGEKYINAVSHGAQAVPLLLPGMGAGMDLDSLEPVIDLEQVLDLAHGILLTGSVSNVDPSRYGQHRDKTIEMDLQRDESVFPLIERALARRLPILAICRGIQELNVALGGTLHPQLHKVEGYIDHREPHGVSRELMYAPTHDVEVVRGGRLEKIIGPEPFMVNSLHGQGIDKVAPQLRSEAIAADGVVEAVSLDSHFVLGVQWHPEWAAMENMQSKAIFTAFGDAMRDYASISSGDAGKFLQAIEPLSYTKEEI